ncbi:hypothetical protein [Streptomyces sp. GSL17-111]|uniref:hypothetical protein n=1 Tax=Streptomyces sp. GSL17-111 TaxID=3121596 RepID=UPI0030F45A48
MRTLQITPKNGPAPSEDDVHRAASSLSDLELVEVQPVNGGLGVRYSGAEKPSTLLSHLAETTETDVDAWEIPWDVDQPLESIFGATTRNIKITMDSETVNTLAQQQYRLFAFKAVKLEPGSTSPGAEPLVWFSSSKFSEKTVVTWESVYEAYWSDTQIVPKGTVEASCARPIDLGQTFNVTADRGCDVSGSRDANQPIYLASQAGEARTCGIGQQLPAGMQELCALPINDRTRIAVRPVEKILLIFAQEKYNTGTVIAQAFAPGACIDLTDQSFREVSFQLNPTKWGPAKPWLEPVSENDTLDFLIER